MQRTAGILARWSFPGRSVLLVAHRASPVLKDEADLRDASAACRCSMSATGVRHYIGWAGGMAHRKSGCWTASSSTAGRHDCRGPACRTSSHGRVVNAAPPLLHWMFAIHYDMQPMPTVPPDRLLSLQDSEHRDSNRKMMTGAGRHIGSRRLGTTVPHPTIVLARPQRST